MKKQEFINIETCECVFINVDNDSRCYRAVGLERKLMVLTL